MQSHSSHSDIRQSFRPCLITKRGAISEARVILLVGGGPPLEGPATTNVSPLGTSRTVPLSQGVAILSECEVQIKARSAKALEAQRCWAAQFFLPLPNLEQSVPKPSTSDRFNETITLPCTLTSPPAASFDTCHVSPCDYMCSTQYMDTYIYRC